MKRSSFDIIAENSARDMVPRRKNQIMFRSNLSFSQFRTYLKLLLASELVQRKKGTFKITSKGQEFLMVHDELVGLFREMTKAKLWMRWCM